MTRVGIFPSLEKNSPSPANEYYLQMDRWISLNFAGNNPEIQLNIVNYIVIIVNFAC